ncbi:hypothetical protein OGATHE_002186 [Ogataea polymorpha]|uniref:Uncharacterized protein n=1 Tax=Ogataea polymorpha TaxID=460523 RepID=A0A9P8TB27_9ASCO|nr:hypothetical protein OGATHE_002186 [Ogataea polymorpha]
MPSLADEGFASESLKTAKALELREGASFATFSNPPPDGFCKTPNPCLFWTWEDCALLILKFSYARISRLSGLALALIPAWYSSSAFLKSCSTSMKFAKLSYKSVRERPIFFL